MWGVGRMAGGGRFAASALEKNTRCKKVDAASLVACNALVVAGNPTVIDQLTELPPHGAGGGSSSTA